MPGVKLIQSDADFMRDWLHPLDQMEALELCVSFLSKKLVLHMIMNIVVYTNVFTVLDAFASKAPLLSTPC